MSTLSNKMKRHRNRPRTWVTSTGLLASAAALGLVLAWGPSATADTFRLAHPGDSVIGVPFYLKSHAHDTLLDIGRQSELGYQDMEQANPKVDVWVPGEDSDVLIPTFFVLPDAPRSGLVLNRPEMRLYYFYLVTFKLLITLRKKYTSESSTTLKSTG